MDNSRGSVRIGPISLFVLIIVLCLAVLAVLSLQTARAELAVAQRQALMTQDVYVNEKEGQEFISQIDAILAWGRNGSAKSEEVIQAVETYVNEQDARTNVSAFLETDATYLMNGSDAQMATAQSVDVVNDVLVSSSSYAADQQGTIVQAEFVQESGRKLVVRLRIEPDMTYQILSWLVSTRWVEPGTGITFWEG